MERTKPIELEWELLDEEGGGGTDSLLCDEDEAGLMLLWELRLGADEELCSAVDAMVLVVCGREWYNM